MKNKISFWIGIGIFILLFISYFIKFNVSSGANYNTYDSLLGIIIFHNPFILALYVVFILYLTFRK